ncbi:hypothetical protein LOY37_25330 [Pseudomonas sp. B21-012]|uniref:hypothetical protein n=1 Tax=Pseudomonas sp. B21-012 TaxID=2895472 RepID=UPI00215F83BF|nr:hypothetical protein [Pseudomonas sp. B21-012]UVM55607.1 hypothetical protein LOY37_25330 [Pseudomonas sp. B21-012]
MSQNKLIGAVHFVVDDEMHDVSGSNLDGYAYLNGGDSTFLEVDGEVWQITVANKFLNPAYSGASEWHLVVVGSRAVNTNSKVTKLFKK